MADATLVEAVPETEDATSYCDVVVTDRAIKRIKELMAEEENPNLKLRIMVKGGGCSGFLYYCSFEQEQYEQDIELDKQGIPILIDWMSATLVNGAIIDFVDDDLAAYGFTIKNPKAVSTCGCGSSFAV